MSTSYREIYHRVLSRIDSYTLTRAVNDDPITFYQVMYPYLLSAFGHITTPMELALCLQYRKEPVYQIEDFTTVDNQTEYQLSIQADENLEEVFFRVVVNGVVLEEGKDYSYNIDNNSIVFVNAPEKDKKLEVHYYYAGEIIGTNDSNYDILLTDYSLRIIVNYTIINWVEKSYNRETVLKGILGSKDYNMFSPANLLKELGAVLDRARKTAYKEKKNLEWMSFLNKNKVESDIFVKRVKM